jgi:hypothetical protein
MNIGEYSKLLITQLRIIIINIQEFYGNLVILIYFFKENSLVLTDMIFAISRMVFRVSYRTHGNEVTRNFGNML